MLKSILKLFKRPHGPEKPITRCWTEVEPERVRTFEETAQSMSAGGLTFTTSSTTELATSRQIEFLKKLGFDGNALTKSEASYLLDTVLRPAEYAISKTFSNAHLLEKELLRALQLAIVHWDYYPSLPRYGPNQTWKALEATGNNPNRPLTKEERMAITDIAFQTLPAKIFLSLASNGVKKYKKQLDATLDPNTSESGTR